MSGLIYFQHVIIFYSIEQANDQSVFMGTNVSCVCQIISSVLKKKLIKKWSGGHKEILGFVIVLRCV